MAYIDTIVNSLIRSAIVLIQPLDIALMTFNDMLLYLFDLYFKIFTILA